jgi:hypothetical protein
MRIIDFTKVIPNYYKNPFSPVTEMKFNPTISLIEGVNIPGVDLFLCIVRKFSRMSGQNASYNLNWPIDHPWAGGEGSKTWWNTAPKFSGGYDLSEMYILEVFKPTTSNDKIRVKTHLISNGEIDGTDCRIIQARQAEPGTPDLGDYILTYNGNWVNNIKIKNGDCSQWCMLIKAEILRLSFDVDKGYYIIGRKSNQDSQFLCPEISNKMEKNWSVWFYDDRMYFSYGLYPAHDIYELRKTSDSVLTCGAKRSIVTPLINGWHDLYNSTLQDFFHISVTTPAIFIPEIKMFVGIGHVKFRYNKYYTAKTNPFPNTGLSAFLEADRNNILHTSPLVHPVYIYFMYLYAFVPKTYENGTVDIINFKMSDAFIPYSDEKNYLVFPSGITRDSKNDVLLAYGELDESSKVIGMSVNELAKMLSHDQFDDNWGDIKFVHKHIPEISYAVISDTTIPVIAGYVD